MASKIDRRKLAHRSKKALIRTTVLDLLKELTALTKDDALVMATVANIFATCNVRLERTLAPIRLSAPRGTRRDRTVWA